MSVVEDSKNVILTDPVMVPQVKGMGKVIQSIYLTVGVSEVVDFTISEDFMLQLNIHVNGITYRASGLYNKAQLTQEGEITVQEIFVLGPVKEENITYDAIIRYVFK